MAVGILGFQGCIAPHQQLLEKLNETSVLVRLPEDLQKIDRLIIPGGESTTMLKLLRSSGLWEPLQEFAQSNPVWGICAGAILLAKKVSHPEQESLGLLDIRAYRNFYGPQTFSFTENIAIPGIAPSVPVHFIRAPMLEAMGSGVEKLATCNGYGVFFRNQHLWACSFHCELGSNVTLHQAFLDL